LDFDCQGMLIENWYKTRNNFGLRVNARILLYPRFGITIS